MRSVRTSAAFSMAILTACGAGVPTAAPTSGPTIRPSAPATAERPTPEPSPAAIGVQPGESWIAYRWGVPGGGGTIHLIRPDGRGGHQLVPDFDGSEHHPAWSPSGDRIAFGRERPDMPEDLWVVGAAGGKPEKVFDCAGRCNAVRYPQWTMDAKALIYATETWGPAGPHEVTVTRSSIERVDLASGEVTVLVHAEFPRIVELPRLSPDGNRLAFIRTRTGEDNMPEEMVLFVRDLESGDEQGLTGADFMAAHPDWAGDDLLVFNTHDLLFAGAYVASNLYTMGPDGSELRQITDYPVSEDGPHATQPRVVPDGSGVTFTLAEGRLGWEVRRLAFLALDGSGFRWVTPAPTDGTHPAVRPLPG